MKGRATARGRRVLAGILLVDLAAILLSSFALGVLGAVATLAWAALRWNFEDGLARLELRARRRVVEPVLYADSPANVELTLEGENPARLAIALEGPPPEGWAILSGAARADASEWGALPSVRYAARVGGRGSWRFGDARVEARDEHGLFLARFRTPAPLEVRVNASLESIRRGRAYARRKAFEPRRKNPFGLIFREYELEGIREYSPGDRMRDIDWKASTRLQELMTKTMEREMEGIVYCIVDASRTMREKPPGTDITKLDHAADLVLQVGEIASLRNFQIGLIVFDEAGILVDLPASRAKAQERVMAQRILQLPDSLAGVRRRDVAAPGEGAASEGEQEFFAAVRSLHGRGLAAPGSRRGHAGASQAFSRILGAHPAGAVFAFIFSDLSTAPDEMLQGMLALRAKSHRVALGLLPASSYLAPPENPTLRDLENAYRERAGRRRAVVGAQRKGARVYDLTPASNVSHLVEESP